MRNRGILWAGVSCVLASGMMAGVAVAAPANDDWSGATPITALPFTDTVADIETATESATDPVIDCVYQGDHAQGDDSVWYAYTTGANDEFVDVSAAGYDTQLSVFGGAPETGFVGVRGGCNDDGVGVGGNSRIFGLRLRANTRYSFLVANYSLNSPPSSTLAFSLQRSAVYAVTKTDDTSDGICDADCSLRDAIAASATPGAIVLPAGTFALSGGAKVLTGGAWYGAGMDRTIIDGQGVSRLVTLASDTHYDTFALHDLTLANGRAPDGDATGGRGGALYSAAREVIALDRVAVRGSVAAGSGGGIYVIGNLKVQDSVFSGNLSQSSGGGIAVAGWTFDIERTAIVGNEARAAPSQPTTFSGGGGGLYTDLRYGARISNTTISGNRTAGEAAALIRTFRYYMNIHISNSSIVDNDIGVLDDMSQQGGLKIDNTDGGMLFRPVQITHTVIAGNRPATAPERSADCVITSRVTIATRYNLVQVPQGCGFAGEGDVTGIDPQLEPLDTSLVIPAPRPAPGSPLIDAGDPAGGCERTDARGVVRPLDGNGDGVARCDIGAIEVEVDGIFKDSFEAR